MMLRQLLIVLLHQFLCYGSWALRPPPPQSPSFSSPSSQSSSSSTTSSSSSSSLPKSIPNSRLSESSANSGIKILSIQANCTREIFEIKIDLSKKFHGILFAQDFLEECRSRGNMQSKMTLRLPTSGCGVRSEPKSDGSLELSVRIMLQMDEKLRQSSDIGTKIKCNLPANMMSMDIMDNGDVRTTFRNGRMKTTNEKITVPPPRVRIWLELGSSDGKGSVEVGQPTTLSVRAVVPGSIGVRVVDCAALDGLGESSQKLLDDRGCSTDEQVMPALHTRYRPAEEGWSKPHEDDLVEKLFTATFPAFKFPDRERLHVSCGVQLCKGSCPNVNCEHEEPLMLDSSKHLARIEVFNSLAVTAPQIEIDRLRTNRRNNMSAEEYPPKVKATHTEGTLCLSISKLAMSFCILGLIFLVAVIISVSCLLRSRGQNSCRPIRVGSTSMFSSSSSESHHSRFGSKLLISYPRGSLPYGRVY